MRRIFFVILSFLAFFPAIANADVAGDALLNRISMRLNAEQWVPTKSAVVTVGVNAGVSDAALATIQEDVIKKLNSLSSAGEWHIVSFERSLDAASLEKIQMSAQARLPSSALPTLRDKAKSMSKPGETYTLDNVQFTPSEDELRAAQMNLRNNIYAQAKDELERINKLYPDQKYSIHEINFLPQVMLPQPMAMQTNFMVRAGGMASVAQGTIAVGDKLTADATVVFASSPDVDLIKSLH